MIKRLMDIIKRIFGWDKSNPIVSTATTPVLNYTTVLPTHVNRITVKQIKAVVNPRYREYVSKEAVRALNETILRYGISNPLRVSHFLAQVLHESGELRYLAEVWGPSEVQERYEGRTDLGNHEAGDGYKFRGRGLIQLTGRSNYIKYSEDRGVDFIRNPDLVSRYPMAADVAGWYWSLHDLNTLADQDDLRAITKKVNGGYNGFEHRSSLLDKCKVIFNVEKD